MAFQRGALCTTRVLSIEAAGRREATGIVMSTPVKRDSSPVSYVNQDDSAARIEWEGCSRRRTMCRDDRSRRRRLVRVAVLDLLED
jgi:hypothetical protein